MKQSQREALEALVGRSLSAGEVETLTPLLEVRDDVKIAEVLSAGRYKPHQFYIGTGTVLANFAGKGGIFMDKLVEISSNGTGNRDVFWALDLIKLGRFDVGDASSQAQMTNLALAFPEFAEGLSKLKNLGRVPDVLAFSQVSEALNKI